MKMGTFASSLVLVLFLHLCSGNRLKSFKSLESKINGMEMSLSEDIKLLRETVEMNTNEIQRFIAIVNKTASQYVMTDLSDLIDKGHSVPSSSQEQGTKIQPHNGMEQSAGMKSSVEDLNRVKRAFYDGKVHLHEVEFALNETLDIISSTFNDKFDKLTKHLNKQTEVTNKKIETENIRSTEIMTDYLLTKLESHRHDIAAEIKENIRSTGEMVGNLSMKIESHSKDIAAEIEIMSSKLEEVHRMNIALDNKQSNSLDTILKRIVDNSKHIRLAGSTSSNSRGRVEVKYNGVWGTVCDDVFSSNNSSANVVCRELGFRTGIYKSAPPVFGEGSGPIWLDNVRCTGNEDSIFDCPRRKFGIHDCEHGEDAGVICTDIY